MHSKQSSNPLTKEMNYESCKHAKAAADKIESGVILNNSQQDFRAFKVAPNHTTYLMNSARRDYFSNVIVKTSSNQIILRLFFDYWKRRHEILSFRSCTYICGSTGSW